MEMTIGKRFIITSGVLLLFITILATVAGLSLNKISADAHMLATDSLPGTFYAAAIQGDELQLRGDYLRQISETNPATIQEIEQNIVTNNEHLAEDLKNYQATITEAGDQTDFDKLKALIAAVQQGWDKVRLVSRAGKSVEAFQSYNTYIVPPMLPLKVQLAQFVSANKKSADVTMGSTVQTVRTAWWLILMLGLVSMVAGVAVSWFMIAALNAEMNRSVTELSEGAEQIASAASQVSASSQSLAQGSSEQAASLEETSSSSEEINSMARKNTDNSLSMAKLVGQSQEMFVKTNQQLEEMVVSMDEINESSGKIAKIIKVIDEIAFQTNILALNAAVEAARAGEAGMGFAVVADEVRNLAQRSAQAAKDTALLIEDSISKSHIGKSKVDQVAAAIFTITGDIGKVKTLAEEVSLGSEEQSRGLEQISRAISQMEQVTQTTAATAEESAAAAEELNAQSEALRDVVGRLHAMVSGHEVTGDAIGRSRRTDFSGNAITPFVASRPSKLQRTVKPSNSKGRAHSGPEDESAAMAAFRAF